MIPDESEKRNDAIDFLIDGMSEKKEIVNENGERETVTEFNSEIAWFKGHIINQPFGRFALYLKRFENMAHQAFFHMSPERALNVKTGMLNIVLENKRSIDAKSSETYKDKQNTQSALIHILSKNKVEKQYTLKGNAKKSFIDGIMGREATADEEGD